ncbi:hypothetical protein VTN77DRAFT_4697 [Rasamsonia byssochlamydoides]|uniref:uncharacterized protein n=1 Tax=Rasamsonia byssochlamydoides TaxID=89139 RepID=UPI0037442533
MSLHSRALTHPWTNLTAQVGLTALTVGFTRPESLMRRIMLLPILLIVPWYFSVATARVENMFQVSWGASQAVLALYQYLDVALVNKWDFDFSGPQPRDPTKKNKVPFGSDTFWNRVKFGFYAASSFRNCSTPFETRGLQPFNKKDLAYTPSTKRYVRTAALHFFACYLLHTLTSLGDPKAQALFLSWKPLFNFENGFPFTIRRFWSHFWHLSVKKRIYSPSMYVTDKWLKSPRGSLAHRYTTPMLTFMLSMAFPGLGDIACGIPPSKTGALQFFMAQGVAIVFEDLVQYFYRKLFASSASSNSRGGEHTRWQKDCRLCLGLPFHVLEHAVLCISRYGSQQ